MDGLIKINHSRFSEEFKSIELDATFLLSKNYAQKVWKFFIDRDFKPYHQLGHSHWLYSFSSTVVGSWTDSYNNEDYVYLEKLISSRVNWNLDDQLLFLMSRHFIIKTTWSDFRKASINFLMCEDESPILINQDNHRHALSNLEVLLQERFIQTS